MSFLESVTGITNGSWYNFWSGIFADITIFGGLGVLYKRNKCKTCFRLAHYPIEGTHYKTCAKHTTKALHARIAKRHKLKYPLFVGRK